MKPFRTHRADSTRAQWWDYGDSGRYFITICTANKKQYFGEIHNKQLQLSIIGHIALDEWTKSFIIRKELQCNEFQFMPNHIHAILSLVYPKSGAPQRDKSKNVGIAYRPPQSISTFVSGFKSAVTSQLISKGLIKKTIWQPRFHDRIIRNQHEYDLIRRYILENVHNWPTDRYFTADAS